jgi:hypothetical protein
VPAPYSDVLLSKNAFMVKQIADDSPPDSDFNERSAETVDPSHELVPLYLSGNSEPDPSEFTSQLRKRGGSISSLLLVSVLAVSAIAIVFALFSSDNMRKIVADTKVLIGFTRPASSEPSQLDSVKLTAEQIKRLNEVSQPKLNFPNDFLENVKAFGYNGSTIDGQVAPVNPMSPASDEERY